MTVDGEETREIFSFLKVIDEKESMARKPFMDKHGMKKGAWSPEEDDKLKSYIQKYGHWNWRELPRFAGLSRCGKSCRLRWMNYLRPNLKLGNYTAEEENTIIKLRERYGNKWSAIAANLPGRTDNEIKNYWHTHLKRRTMKQTQLIYEAGEQSQEITAPVLLETKGREPSTDRSQSEASEIVEVSPCKDVSLALTLGRF